MHNTEQKVSIGEIRSRLLKEQRQLQWRKLRTNRSLIIGVVILTVMVLIALLAPVLAPHDPYTMKVAERLKPPSALHPLGTDEFGRDLLTRVMYGARISMTVGLAVSLLSSAFGLVIGLYASYYKALDHIFMRRLDCYPRYFAGDCPYVGAGCFDLECGHRPDGGLYPQHCPCSALQCHRRP